MHPNNKLERKIAGLKRRKRVNHPEEILWINRYREIRKQAKRGRKQMDAVIEGGVVFEAKLLQDIIPCEICGNVMDFVSQELGYSCRNEACDLHVEAEV